ncbi:uncharacterized protein LOC131437039 [Malaya genurostris]|uniref:uncharacterized protein LOC131437039 n=1 Tax=Malaya genurostris TaxID=325434 RepID=UPI0026F3E089|nr:uncharacterized protein LOC131437039 [Malaya genurostris]
MSKTLYLILVFLRELIIDIRGISQPHTEPKSAATCAVNINDQLPKPQPLILVPETEQFRNPTSDNRLLRLNAGETVELACDTNGGFSISPSSSSIIVVCVIDRTFNFNSTMFSFDEFSCARVWYSSARRTNISCEDGAFIVEVGFDMGVRFPKLMDICHNENTFENHWVKHEFTRAIAGYQSGNPRPEWYQGYFYPGIDVNGLYAIDKQRKTIGVILKSESLADSVVVDYATGLFMARGHIAARVDFILGPQQNGTFWFLNAAPQWQNFNEGNWLRIEESVRNFVTARNLQVTVYSGTYGVHTLTDVNGDQQPIYLDFDPDGTQRLPAPKIFYKILLDESNKAGVALIGVNNIYIDSMEQIDDGYMFCEDIGDKIRWIDWNRRNFSLGYSYACEVNPFLKRIGHLAGLDVPHLLI